MDTLFDFDSFAICQLGREDEECFSLFAGVCPETIISVFGEEHIRNMIHELLGGYSDMVPFHSKHHALDVAHTASLLARHSDVFHDKPMERFAFLVAALGHDYGHEGWTNAYMRTLDHGIMKDFESLETYSAEQTCRVVKKHCPSMEPQHIALIRDLIHCTDMSLHTTFLQPKCVQPRVPSLFTDVQKMQILMKVSDIGAVFKPWRVTVMYGQKLFEEIKRETEHKRQSIGNSVPVTPHGTWHQFCYNQPDFIQNTLGPCVFLIRPWIPEAMYQHMDHAMKEACKKWKSSSTTTVYMMMEFPE